jgi:TackOD1 domain-containing protein
MNTARSNDRSSNRNDGGDVQPYPDDVIAIVGRFPGPPPRLPGIRYVSGLDHPCGLVALLPGCDPDATLTRLADSRRLPVPIADFTGGNLPRADFAANFPTEQSFAEAIESTQLIRQLLNGLPPLDSDVDRDKLLALALIYSRRAVVEPIWDPNSLNFIDYPLLAGLDHARTVLEQLAQPGLLSRRFFERLNLCRHCGSARLAAREVCVGCGSAHLREETLIHHYRCAHQAPRSQFQDGQTLMCPKCSRVLRHYGVDYDTPSVIHLCRECDEVVTQPDVSFACADCGSKTTGDDTGTCDWHGYNLTPEGERAALDGRLPTLGLDSLMTGVAGHRAPRDLAMMIDFAARLYHRYQRSFAVIVIDFQFGETPRAMDQIRAETLVWDVIRGAIRESDFVAALEHQLVLLMPETPPENADVVVDRVNRKLSETSVSQARINAQVVGVDHVAGLIDELLNA